METTQNSTHAAFNSFLKQDYKACLTVLNKLKSARTNEKLTSRINHNLALTEFMNGRMSNPNNLILKLDDVLKESKAKTSHKRKDSAKGAPAGEDENAENNALENNDDPLIKYNYAIALNLAGKKNKSLEILREIFHSKEMVFDYPALKNSLAYLDLAILNKDFAAIKSVLEFLEKIKMNIGIVNADPDSMSTDNEDGKEPNTKKAEKESRHYNPLIFGAEVYKHGEIPLRVSRAEFDFVLSVYHTCLLFSLKDFDLAKKKLKTCKTAFNEFTRVLKDGKNEKGDIHFTYAPAISPYIEKHANILFSFTKAYMAYQMQQYTKCIRFMSPSEDMKMLDEGYTCYQLNNIACCHLRMQKYALAAYYFSRALSILQKINKELKEETSSFKKYEALLIFNTIQQYPFILHNYALALSQMEKYEEAIDMYTKLSEFWPDNPRIWYRLGLCHVSKYQKILDLNQKQKKNGLYQALLDYPNYSKLQQEEEKAGKNKSKNAAKSHTNQEQQYYTRFVLNVHDGISRDSDDEESMSNGAGYTSQATNINKGNEDIQGSAKLLAYDLDKSAKAFRNATMIAKKKKIKYQKDQPLQVVLKQQDSNRMSEDFEESKTVDTNTTNETEEDRSNSMIVKLARNIKDYQDILQSSLTYLAYIALCNGEINNSINYAKSCLELIYVTDENKYICLMYLVEAHCLLGKQKEALSEINTLNLEQIILTHARNVLGMNQAFLMPSLSSKVVIYANLATIHLLNNNLTSAQSSIDSALKSLDPSTLQTPIPLLNLLIYLNLKMEKPEQALQILKRRKVLGEGNGNLLLNIVKPVN